jgi:hypothetical protein
MDFDTFNLTDEQKRFIGSQMQAIEEWPSDSDRVRINYKDGRNSKWFSRLWEPETVTWKRLGPQPTAVEEKLDDRDRLVLGIAISYLFGNIDDCNEALCDEGLSEESGKIMILVRGGWHEAITEDDLRTVCKKLGMIAPDA